ncbi:MAG: hypothetical protein AAGD22_01820 [Verrucomicrobiota bacterium]
MASRYLSAKIDQAEIACALERFRIRHGEYPSKLSELVSDFLAAVPVDGMDGKPMRYRRDGENERYLIYSVGSDRENDDGARMLDQKLLERKRVYSRDFEGDWVWGYPARNGEAD